MLTEMNEFEKKMSELRSAHKQTNRRLCGERDNAISAIRKHIAMLRMQNPQSATIGFLVTLMSETKTKYHRLLSREGVVYKRTNAYLQRQMAAHYSM